jgi:hypothetical protein
MGDHEGEELAQVFETEGGVGRRAAQGTNIRRQQEESAMEGSPGLNRRFSRDREYF